MASELRDRRRRPAIRACWQCTCCRLTRAAGPLVQGRDHLLPRRREVRRRQRRRHRRLRRPHAKARLPVGPRRHVYLAAAVLSVAESR